MNGDKLKKVAARILRMEGQELIRASGRVAESVVKSSEIIINHSGKVVICGLGKSGLIGQKIVATLCSTGTQAVFLHAAEALHGDLGIYAPGDPTILISKSGSTEEHLRLIPILKDFNSPLIGIIGNMNSPLVRLVDIVLDASVKNEADPLGVVPTSSTTLTLAIGDALAGVLMTHRKFNHEDFARIHPGGDLGRKLRLTVKNVMQTVKNVATVLKSDRLRGVVIKMTEKPQGAALVIDRENKLQGIITDGDLRRCLATNGDIDKLTVAEVMTENPVSIPVESLLQGAIALMEDRESQISVLPVVEEDGACAGLLRLHDIYQTHLL
ncbi:MAG: KpsF/GutQ family sugar-phosphate isomerase [Candidatus Neomarinimicrobiota bacterium]